MMNNVFSSVNNMKYSCVKAYLHRQLVEAEKNIDSSEITTVNTEYVKNKLLEIIDRFKKTKCTFENIKFLSNKFPIYNVYYIQIGKIVGSHFKVNGAYIPSFLALEVLSQYKQKGYKDFEDFDFIDLQSNYETYLANDKDFRQLLKKHYKCAFDIVNNLDNIQKNIFTKKKRKK